MNHHTCSQKFSFKLFLHFISLLYDRCFLLHCESSFSPWSQITGTLFAFSIACKDSRHYGVKLRTCIIPHTEAKTPNCQREKKSTGVEGNSLWLYPFSHTAVWDFVPMQSPPGYLWWDSGNSMHGVYFETLEDARDWISMSQTSAAKFPLLFIWLWPHLLLFCTQSELKTVFHFQMMGASTSPPCTWVPFCLLSESASLSKHSYVALPASLSPCYCPVFVPRYVSCLWCITLAPSLDRKLWCSLR